MTWLKSNCKKACFQLEQGDTGYRHWQGRFSLMKKRNKSPLMNLFTSLDMKVPNYLEQTTTQNQKECFYVMKADTRINGPFKFGESNEEKMKEKYIPKQYRDIELRPWQKQVIDSMSDFNNRTINYIYDNKGNLGKSTVASIAALKYGGIKLPPLNDFKEIMALLCNICFDRNIRDPKIILLDLPRAMRKEHLFSMYSAIESIKDGMLYDTRYHYKEWWIDSPQIWVFSNKLPDLDYLSIDRWTFWSVTGDQLTKLDTENIEIISNEYSELNN